MRVRVWGFRVMLGPKSLGFSPSGFIEQCFEKEQSFDSGLSEFPWLCIKSGLSCYMFS